MTGLYYPSTISDTKYFRLELKDGIVHFQHKPGAINLEIAKQIVADRLDFFSGFSWPMLITGEGLTDINKEARQFLAKEGTKGVTAGALLTKTVFSMCLGNFFLRVYPPPMPVRLFTEEEPALEWLQQFIKKLHSPIKL